MIVAEFKFPRHKDTVYRQVRYLANRGDWFGETWVVAFTHGLLVVVEGGNEQEVLDNLMDSHLGHLIRMDEKDAEEFRAEHGEDSLHYAGNHCYPVYDYDLAFIVPCKVHYFVNAEHFEKTGSVK